jgi:hypothetical protein
LPISATDVITPAIEHAKQQLFKPFRLKQWTRIAFVGFLAGELSSGGCGNFQVPTFPQHTNGSNHFAPMLLGSSSLSAGTQAVIITVLVAAALVFMVIFTYLNSMMRFVLFDSVITRECRIRESWRRRTQPGFRYFLWQLGVGLVALLVAAVLFGGPVGIAYLLGWFKGTQEHMVGLILGGLGLFFLFFAYLIVFAVAAVMTKDFIVPQMALEGIGAVEGWQRLLQMMKTEKLKYAGYIGMKIILAIAASILVSIISLIAILILAIPIGGLGLAAVLSGKAAGMQWDAMTITLAVVAGCIAFLVILYLVCLISVPTIIFFPAYSMYFFAARYPLLRNVLYPLPVPQPPPASPPPSYPPPEPIS